MKTTLKDTGIYRCNASCLSSVITMLYKHFVQTLTIPVTCVSCACQNSVYGQNKDGSTRIGGDLFLESPERTSTQTVPRLVKSSSSVRAKALLISSIPQPHSFTSELPDPFIAPFTTKDSLLISSAMPWNKLNGNRDPSWIICQDFTVSRYQTLRKFLLMPRASHVHSPGFGIEPNGMVARHVKSTSHEAGLFVICIEAQSCGVISFKSH
ncbi:hypothetical protein Baya_6127 [Bagarius yarrelli]|uniref:Uncharacterized protein n=1 Tax=Bagarius yarrelli TaxID=175774 RepID=A0A556U526_BAGYA|nr:hypothetical protein Baya_6127 [Bagarius yarrelli]